MSALGRATGAGIALRVARFAALILFAFCLAMYIYANAVVIASASTNLNAIRQSNAWTDDAVRDAVAQIGENIQVRRFARFKLGEGIEKRETDFAAEVAAAVKG